MSIVIVRGPEATHSLNHPPSAVPNAVRALLVEHAAMAGKVIALRNCLSEAELIDSLQHARELNAEFILLDPGACARSYEELSLALKELDVPYIEVHDDHVGALESSLSPACGPRLNLIQGYGSQSYTLALSIALEHLGCAECECDVHVGT